MTVFLGFSHIPEAVPASLTKRIRCCARGTTLCPGHIVPLAISALEYLPPAIEAVQISWLAVHTTSLYIYRMIYSRRDGGGTHTPDPPHVVTFPHHLDFWWLIVCHGISCHLARRSSEIVLLTFAHERWPSPSVTHRMLPLTSPCTVLLEQLWSDRIQSDVQSL